jgi:hypothetical protein
VSVSVSHVADVAKVFDVQEYMSQEYQDIYHPLSLQPVIICLIKCLLHTSFDS